MPRKPQSEAAVTIDMLETSAATPTRIIELEPIQHNAPTVQQSQELSVAPLTGPISQALQWMKQGGTLAEMRELLELQRDYEKGEAEKAFNVAFAAFKAEGVVVIKAVQYMDGPLIGRKYEDLFAVVDAVTPLLSKHGLSTSWETTRDEPDWIEVTCKLKHVLGHAEKAAMGAAPDVGGSKNKIHARMSTVTYLQRYTLKTILGIAARGEDTDGNVPQADTTDSIDPALLKGAQEAAMNGWNALAKYIKSLTEAQRIELTPASKALKEASQAADASIKQAKAEK